jgi:hypothetical protein
MPQQLGRLGVGNGLGQGVGGEGLPQAVGDGVGMPVAVVWTSLSLPVLNVEEVP